MMFIINTNIIEQVDAQSCTQFNPKRFRTYPLSIKCINHISAFRTLLLGMDNTETQVICEEEAAVHASLAAQPTPPKTDPAAVTSSEKPGKDVDVEAGP